ncbi:hypothetical protein [Herbaspirillum huttiense]|uniref:hypothetical protein n=1 Tax=Herbaspirillum huttiense TaxID=863372 RepID=UPI0031D161A6
MKRPSGGITMKQPEGSGKERGNGVDGGGNGPHDGDMETRVKALEDGLSDIKSDVAVIKSNYATKADISDLKADFKSGISEIHKSQGDMLKWMVGSIIVMGSLGIAVMTFVVNNLIPRSTPVSQVAAPQAIPAAPPIIINVPPLTATPSTQETRLKDKK